MKTVLKNAKQTRNELLFAFVGIALLIALGVATNNLKDLGLLVVLEILILPFLISQSRYCRKLKKEEYQNKGAIEFS